MIWDLPPWVPVSGALAVRWVRYVPFWWPSVLLGVALRLAFVVSVSAVRVLLRRMARSRPLVVSDGGGAAGPGV